MIDALPFDAVRGPDRASSPQLQSPPADVPSSTFLAPRPGPTRDRRNVEGGNHRARSPSIGVRTRPAGRPPAAIGMAAHRSGLHPRPCRWATLGRLRSGGGAGGRCRHCGRRPAPQVHEMPQEDAPFASGGDFSIRSRTPSLRMTEYLVTPAKRKRRARRPGVGFDEFVLSRSEWRRGWAR